jgi:hypothetical protein
MALLLKCSLSRRRRLRFHQGWRLPLLTFCALLVLLSPQSAALSATKGPRPSLRITAAGRPRLASAVGVALQICARVGLCARSFGELVVNVDARSNRAVLRGELDQIAVRVTNSHGPFLKVSKLDIQGSDLKLGLAPVMVTTVLPIALCVIRPSLMFVLSCLLLLRCPVPRRLPTNMDKTKPSNSNTENNDSIGSRLCQRFLGGEPSEVNYAMTICDDDVARSSLLQLSLRSILRSLMINSVLGVAASAFDTAKMLATAETDKSGALVLPRQSQQRANTMVLTKLLSATSFELVSAKFSSGRLVLESEAVLPDGDEGGEFDKRSRLSFSLRTTPEATTNAALPFEIRGKKKQRVLAFSEPECRFSMGAAVGGPFGALLPDVWLPVGAGVAVPLGLNHRLQRVDIQNGICHITGQVSIHGKQEEEEMGLGDRIGSFFSLPPASPKALPPSKK